MLVPVEPMSSLKPAECLTCTCNGLTVGEGVAQFDVLTRACSLVTQLTVALQGTLSTGALIALV